MKNFDTIGDNVTLLASAAVGPQSPIASGDACVAGRLAGVAAFTCVAGGNVVIQCRGVFRVNVKSIHNGVSVGETVFIDPATAALTDDFAATPFGVALETVANDGANHKIKVRLFGATPGATGAFS